MRTQKGFTLIEIMLALVIFAILASITASSMYHAFDTRKRIANQAQALNTIEFAIALMKQDTLQAVSRTILGNGMHIFPEFTGHADYVEFTRDGRVNPNAFELRSTLVRVAYLCKKDKLIRRFWERVDTPNRAAYQDKVILDNLNQCKFAYVTKDNDIVPEWQEYPSSDKNNKMPNAIRVTLSLQNGNMSLLFIFPAELYGS